MKLRQSAVLLGFISTASAEETISVQLVQYRVGASLGSEVPFNVKPMGHDYAAELSFLVKGKGPRVV